MAEKLLIKKQITLVLGGLSRYGNLYFDPEYQQLTLEQEPAQIEGWTKLGFTPWRLTQLTNSVPMVFPANFVEIHDFNHTEGVAGQLEKLGIGRVYQDKPLVPFAKPANPRRIKVVSLHRDLIDQARFVQKHPPREKRANPWLTPAPR